MRLICICVQKPQYHASVLAQTKHRILGAIKPESDPHTYTQAQTVCLSMVQPRTVHCASSTDHMKLATGICSSTLATTSRNPCGFGPGGGPAFSKVCIASAIEESAGWTWRCLMRRMQASRMSAQLQPQSVLANLPLHSTSPCKATVVSLVQQVATATPVVKST